MTCDCANACRQRFEAADSDDCDDPHSKRSKRNPREHPQRKAAERGMIQGPTQGKLAHDVVCQPMQTSAIQHPAFFSGQGHTLTSMQQQNGACLPPCDPTQDKANGAASSEHQQTRVVAQQQPPVLQYGATHGEHFTQPLPTYPATGVLIPS